MTHKVSIKMGDFQSDSSRNSVDLTDTCLESLQAHRKRQVEEKLKTGESYQDYDLIFATPKGTPLNDRNVVNRLFEPALKDVWTEKTAVPRLAAYLCLSVIAQGESPKYTQRQMRHASIQIAFDRYGHLFPDTNREVARRRGPNTVWAT